MLKGYIHIHEDCNGEFYFSDGEDMQSESLHFKDAIHYFKFLKSIGIEPINITNINWDAYIS